MIQDQRLDGSSTALVSKELLLLLFEFLISLGIDHIEAIHNLDVRRILEIS